MYVYVHICVCMYIYMQYMYVLRHSGKCNEASQLDIIGGGKVDKPQEDNKEKN